MKYKVTELFLIKPVVGDRNSRSTLRINRTHPNTSTWTLELAPEGVICTMASGKLKLIPFSNITEMIIEKVEPVKTIKPKKSK